MTEGKQMENAGIFLEEAELFGRYLLKKSPNTSVKKRYEKAMSVMEIELDTLDQKVWHFIRRFPYTLGFFDSGLVLIKPFSQLRRKIFVMVAILETSPEYTQIFFSRRFSPFYILYLMIVGFRSVIKALVGIILIKLISIGYGKNI